MRRTATDWTTLKQVALSISEGLRLEINEGVKIRI